ncbi:MAG: dihydroorotate dehydrogenase-like protein [Phycisphaeraceae bacterium]
MKLHTSYLGFDLPHPIIPGACPLANDLDSARRLEDAGAPMLTMTSLFEEEISRESVAAHAAVDMPKEQFAEALSYLPEPEAWTVGPEDYLDRIFKLKQALSIPVVASLNGTSLGGWLRHARAIEDAGADALEVNLYSVATEFNKTAREIESEQAQIIEELKKQTTLPLAVKLSPFYTSLPNTAAHLASAGAEAIVLYNRFYQPDLDIEELELARQLTLSTSAELNPRLRWLAILSGKVKAQLALTGGVHSVEDAVKGILCGADVCQIVSSLLIHGPQHIAELSHGLSRWLDEHEYASLEQARGSMNQVRSGGGAAYARANYIHLLRTWTPGE